MIGITDRFVIGITNFYDIEITPWVNMATILAILDAAH